MVAQVATNMEIEATMRVLILALHPQETNIIKLVAVKRLHMASVVAISKVK